MRFADLEHLASQRPFQCGKAAGLSGLRTAQGHFRRFLVTYKLDFEDLVGDPEAPAIGARLSRLCSSFAVHLGETSTLGGATIGTYARSIWRIVIEANGITPSKRSAQFDAILRFYAKTKPTSRRLQRCSAPLPAVAACFRLSATSWKTAAAAAAICLCYAGAMRFGELLSDSSLRGGCDWQDFELLHDNKRISGIRVRLGLHKGDSPIQFTIVARAPIVVECSRARFRVGGHPYCGVSRFLRWAAHARARTPSPRATRASGVRELAYSLPRSGPVFAEGSTRVRRDEAVALLRTYCDPTLRTFVYGHSLRIAAVTTLDRAQVPFDTIRRFGRWASVNACGGYLRSAQEGLPLIDLRETLGVACQQPAHVLSEVLALHVDASRKFK